jgi:hypothetical protein
MLGGRRFSLFGPDNPEAFGHVGLTNVLSWADPERALAVALCASGKPIVSMHVVPLFGLLAEISRAFPKLPSEQEDWALRPVASSSPAA